MWRILDLRCQKVSQLGYEIFHNRGMKIFTTVNESVLNLCILNLLHLTVSRANCEFIHNRERLWVELLHFCTCDCRFHTWHVKVFIYVNSSGMDMFIRILGLTLWHLYCESLVNYERLWNELVHFPTCDCWNWRYNTWGVNVFISLNTSGILELCIYV